MSNTTSGNAAAPSNPYTPGECTWGAKNLAPWLPSGLGNADTWFSRATGTLPTGTTPQVGAAMVFNSGYPGSQGFGHVGIVTSIGANGLPVIQEMNALRDGGGFGVYDTYQTTASDMSYLSGYIYNPANPAGTPSPTASATLTSGLNFTGPWGWLFPQPAVPGGPGYVNLDPSSIVAGILGFVQHAGEVLVGGVLVLYGIHLISKEMGAGAVNNIIGKVPGIGTLSKVVR